MARRDLTKAAEILSGNRGTKPLSQGVPWDRGTARDNDTETGRKPAPMLDSAVPRNDGTTRDNVSVPLSHTPLGVGRGTSGTDSDGQDCSRLPADVEDRLHYLLSIRAIDAEDAALVRRRFHAYADEWLMLLDACEAAALARR